MELQLQEIDTENEEHIKKLVTEKHELEQKLVRELRNIALAST